MLYKEFGKTGKKLSVIGFGGMRFIKDGKDYDIDKCAEVVLKANELGINYFDTAPYYYCNGKSEIIIGRALKRMKHEYYISTKSAALSEKQFRIDLEGSLKRLGVDKINFFHMWCVLSIANYKERLKKDGSYEAALKAKDKGLIEHIVFSTHCLGDETAAIIKEGRFEGVTLSYNIMNFPYRTKGLKAAYEAGIGVATMNPLGGGLIPQKAEFFSFIKGNSSESVVEAALRFNTSHKEITTVLTGMGTMEEVISNAKAGDRIEEISDRRVKEIKGRLFSTLNELCTGCGYCNGCPEDIEIVKFMVAYNHRIIGSVSEGLNMLRWNMVARIGKAQKCIQCGECEKRCTQHLPIIERLKEISRWR